MATPNIVPRADSEGGLGTASKYWGSAYIDLIYVGAGKVGRDADNLIDFSTDNQIKIRVNGTNEIFMNSARFAPSTNDGYILGGASNQWSDLFLASGAVINFDDGNVILTHSSGVLKLEDNNKLNFGAGNDLEIYHDATNSKIDNRTGNLTINNGSNGGDIIFSNDDGSGGETPYLTLDGSAVKTLFYKNTEHQDSIKAQFGESGDLGIFHNGSNSYIENDTGDLYIQNNTDNGAIRFKASNSTSAAESYFYLDGANQRTTFDKNFRMLDNVVAQFGTSAGLQISASSSNSFIQSGIGNLNIIQNKQNQDIVFQGDDGQASDNTVATYFYLDGSSATHDGSATTSLYTNWPDKSRISMGTSHDLQIYHDGTDSSISNNVGDLYIVNSADGKDIIFKSDDGSGGTTTYFQLDGSSNIMIGYKSLYMLDDKRVYLGTAGDLEIYHDGTTSYIANNNGNISLVNHQDDGDIKFFADDGDGGIATYFLIDGSAAIHDGSATTALFTNWPDKSRISLGTSHDLQISHDGGNSYVENTTNDLIFVNYADDRDIIFKASTGSATAAEYFRLDGGSQEIKFYKTISNQANVNLVMGGGQIKLNDSGFIYLGESNDLQIYHDSSNSKIVANGTGALIITQGAADQDIILKCDDGSGGETAYLTLDGSTKRVEVDVEMGINTPAAYTAHSNANELVVGNGSGSQGITIYSGSSNVGSIFFADDLDEEGAGDSPVGNRDGVIDYSHANFEFNFKTAGNQQALELKTSSATFAGTITADSITTSTGSGAAVLGSHLDLGDNQKARFGASDDLEIYHDSSNSYIKDSGTGNLNISGTQVDIMNVDSSEYKARFLTDGAVILYHDAIQKFATSSAGVDVTGDVSITSTAASAVGAGFDGAETATIQIGEVNQEIITTISIDLGTGGATDIVSSGTAGDVIGENDTAAAFITKYDSTKSGVLYKAELICLETPTGGDTDINLVLNATSLAEDAAGEAEGHVIIDGGAQTIGMRTESTASVVTTAAGAHNDYIYLTHGGTTAGTYSAGKFLIRLYGAKATL